MSCNPSDKAAGSRPSIGKIPTLIVLRGVSMEAMTKPSRLAADIAAIPTYEDETIDYGRSEWVQTEQTQEESDIREVARTLQAHHRRAVVMTLIERASELVKLKKGWNSYSASAPTLTAIDNAKTLLALTLQAGIIPERVEPSAMGGVGVAFAAGSREVALEFYNTGNAHALFSDSETEALDTTPVIHGVEGYNTLLQQVRRYIYDHNAGAQAPRPKLPGR